MAVYAYPWFGKHDLGVVRLLGPGLGNLLFPWARAVLACKRHGLKMIDPTWPSIKVGPILRRERDLRSYTGLFNPLPGSISGLRRLAMLPRLRRVTEQEFDRMTGVGSQVHAGGMVVFRGLKGYFEDLTGESEHLWQALVAITRDEHKRALASETPPTIAVHVRRGDFRVGGLTTPLGWYLSMVRALRKGIDRDCPVAVFSDGTDDEIAALLREPLCERVDYGSSIADLLALSRAAVLLGSAHSTFSMWASYLGQMPTVWPPSHRHRGEELTQRQNHVTCGENDRLSSPFIEACSRRLSSDQVRAHRGSGNAI